MEALGVSPKKSLGQNFLVYEVVAEKIASAGDIDKNDAVLEVGGGLGILTEKLAQKAGRLVVVEKDKKLAEFLKSKFCGAKNVEIINQDILKTDLNLKNYKIIANLPYQISSVFLKKFLKQ